MFKALVKDEEPAERERTELQGNQASQSQRNISKGEGITVSNWCKLSLSLRICLSKFWNQKVI